jgi:gliding motility-associated-like protein
VDAGADLTICNGEAVTLSGSGAGVGGTYAWDGGVTDGISFTPATTATYNLLVTTAEGCSGTDAVTITVNPMPMINGGADLTICSGQFVTLSGTGAGIGGTYLWDGGVINAVAFAPLSTATYTVTGTTAAGCTATDAVTVTVNTTPTVNFTADETAGCKPFTVNFSSGSIGAAFDWAFGDGSIGSGATITHTYNSAGLFDVTLTITSVNGCSNSAVYSDYITVVEPPVANFTYLIEDNAEMTYRVTFNNTSDFATHYEWSFGDGSSNSTDENPIHEYPTTTTRSYEVLLTATNDYGCTSSKLQIIRINEKLLFFIPNAFTPDGDDFNEEFRPIFVSGLDVYDYHLIIFNRWGEIVFESYDANYGWDGFYGSAGIVEDGSYVWTISFGETMSDKLHVETGTVTLLK